MSQVMLVNRVLNRVGPPFRANSFLRAFPNPIADGAGSAAALLDEIHRANFWVCGERLSGVGLELAFIATYRRDLARCFAKYGILSLGCTVRRT